MSEAPQLYYATGTLQVEFGSAAELAAALEASLREAPYFGAPWVTVHREAEEPAWMWLGDAILQRPQDWAVIGKALQWLCLLGPAPPTGVEAQAQQRWRRQALVDVCASHAALPLLLAWTEPLAQVLGDVQGTRAALGWGGQPPRLQQVLADQRRFLAGLHGDGQVTLDQQGARLTRAAARDAAELRALAAKTAGRSKTPRALWANGRWGWLAELILLQPWSMPEELQIVEQALRGDDLAQVAAALEWLGEQIDPLRHAALIEQVAADPPRWAAQPIHKKPPGWAVPLRVRGAADARSWGDVLQRLRTLALRHRAVRLYDDLPVFSVT